MNALGRGRAAAGLLLALAASPVSAQISPGPLSRPHAKLEGSAHCLDCHDANKGVAPSKCIACHKPLAERMTAGKGLHANAEHQDCKACHVEHQGVEFELVWWGKSGRGAFDHAQTGRALAGKHRTLACEQCHKSRSFLGAVSECTSCHKDEHRGQFAGRACTACHSEQAWRPAAGFDHARTAWPLTNRHMQVTCDRCHTVRKPDPATPGATYRVFRAVAGRECASCHADVHKARLGGNCSSCHNTAGWQQAKTAGFDHQRTGYPLSGRHTAVACDRCHAAGQPMRLKHEQCSDCHRDAHAGELSRRAEAGRCEGCHDVQGFRPARYGPDEHAKTAFPLHGAHLAVACDECHRSAKGVVPLVLAATRCGECHRDPHRGETAAVAAAKGCETCHRVEAWSSVAFDHGQTRYPLSGRHAQVACGGCHARAEGSGVPRLAFKGAGSECSACHRDPHAGQFAKVAGGQTACERCHATDSLRAARFSHARDSRYALDGAHARLACGTCHKPEMSGGVRVVRYKPLPVACAGCHGERGKVAEGGPR